MWQERIERSEDREVTAYKSEWRDERRGERTESPQECGKKTNDRECDGAGRQRIERP